MTDKHLKQNAGVSAPIPGEVFMAWVRFDDDSGAVWREFPALDVAKAWAELQGRGHPDAHVKVYAGVYDDGDFVEHADYYFDGSEWS